MNSKIEQLLALKMESPDDPFILYALAMEYQKNKRFETAESYYQQLINEHPQYGGTYYHYAQLLEFTNNTNLARSIYEKGLIVLKQKNDVHLYNELNEAYKNFKLNIS